MSPSRASGVGCVSAADTADLMCERRPARNPTLRGTGLSWVTRGIPGEFPAKRVGRANPTYEIGKLGVRHELP